MTPTPLVARLFGIPPRDTPPTPLPSLHVAQGRPVRTLRGPVLWRVPRPPVKPAALAQAQARALRLRRPRSPRLERPRLHARHVEPLQSVFVELVSSYVFGEAPALSIPRPSPWDRWVLAHHLDELDAKIAGHRWGHLHRLDDVRTILDLPRPRRSW